METKAKNKKVIILAIILGLAIVALIGNIFAYFTDKQSLSNTFTIGNISIRLTEGTAWDEAVANNTAPDIAKNIVPGATIAKAPTVENTGKNPAYVYMKVYVPVYNESDLFTYTINAPDGETGGWTERTGDRFHATIDGKDYNIRTYEYNETLEGRATTEQPLFNNVVFSADLNLNAEQVVAFGDVRNVIVKAFAIQAQGVEKNSNELTTLMASTTGETAGLIGGGNQGNPSGQDYSNLPENSVYKLAKTESSGLQKWDRINYTAPNISTASLANAPNGISLDDGDIVGTDASDWVVLDIDSTSGDVYIIPRSLPEKLIYYTAGIESYNGLGNYLDTVASIFVNSDYATSAKSITIDDIDKAEGHTPAGDAYGPISFNHRYSFDEDLFLIDGGSSTMHNNVSTPASDGLDSYTANHFSNLSFWTSSRKIAMHDYGTSSSFGLSYARVENGSIGISGFGPIELMINQESTEFISDIEMNDDSYTIMPVVKLKADALLTDTGTTYQGYGTSNTAPSGQSIQTHKIWSISTNE